MQWKRRPLSCEYALKAEPNRDTFIFSFLIDGFIRPLPPDEHLSKKQQKKNTNLPFLARCGNKTTSFFSLQNAYLSTSAGCWAVGGGSKTDRWDWRRARALFRGHVLLPPGCHSPGRPPPSPVPLFVFIFRTCARTDVHSREFPPTCPGSRGPVCLVSSFLPDAQTGLLDGCDADLVTKFVFKKMSLSPVGRVQAVDFPASVWR